MNSVFLTVKEISKLLKLNDLTIYEYIRNGKLKAVKFGRTYRVEKKNLDKFIKEHQVKTAT